MLRSDLEFVADSYARCLATTEREVRLDVSRYVPKKKFDFHWTLEKILPIEVIKEFQRRRLAIVCYAGGMLECPDPNASLYRPPLFTDEYSDRVVLDFLDGVRTEWDEWMSKKKGVRVIRYGKYTYEQLVEMLWSKIKDELWKRHRDLVELMRYRDRICVNFIHAFKDRIRDEMLRMWITPLELKTYKEASLGDPRAGSKSRMCTLMI